MGALLLCYPLEQLAACRVEGFVLLRCMLAELGGCLGEGGEDRAYKGEGVDCDRADALESSVGMQGSKSGERRVMYERHFRQMALEGAW